jgi:hypothetical protein
LSELHVELVEASGRLEFVDDAREIAAGNGGS